MLVDEGVLAIMVVMGVFANITMELFWWRLQATLMTYRAELEYPIICSRFSLLLSKKTILIHSFGCLFPGIDTAAVEG